MLIKRGDIFYADLNPVVGSEQGGIRPVLVVQNNVGNRHSPTIVVLPLSTAKKHYLPTHIHIRGSKTLPKDSIVLAEQIRTIDRYRLKSYVGSVDFELMEKVEKAMKIEYLRTSLMKFLKQPKNRISAAKIRKMYTVSSRLQGTQREEVLIC